MGLFNRNNTANQNLSPEEAYGNAWLTIIEPRTHRKGIQKMQLLDQQGMTEATVALAMFTEDKQERFALLQKAAGDKNVEAIWELCCMLPHAYCPDPENPADAFWESSCRLAATHGSVDAMNELGNTFHRRHDWYESMYWYLMANAYGHPHGMVSIQGIAREWAGHGCPEPPESDPSDRARQMCIHVYLQMHAGMEPEPDMHSIQAAALNGLPIAAYLAGDIFEAQGQYAMAYKMYEVIAREDDPHGLKCCADMLFIGRGVPADREKAYQLYLKAASFGEREAMFVMGELTKGVNRNIAAYWYGLAHTRGYQPALQRMGQLL